MLLSCLMDFCLCVRINSIDKRFLIQAVVWLTTFLSFFPQTKNSPERHWGKRWLGTIVKIWHGPSQKERRGVVVHKVDVTIRRWWTGARSLNSPLIANRQRVWLSSPFAGQWLHHFAWRQNREQPTKHQTTPRTLTYCWIDQHFQHVTMLVGLILSPCLIKATMEGNSYFENGVLKFCLWNVYHLYSSRQKSLTTNPESNFWSKAHTKEWNDVQHVSKASFTLLPLFILFAPP